MKYLSLWVTHDGIRALKKHIKSIKNTILPTTQKVVHKFIDLVYYD